MINRIIFRADGNSSTGLGHLYRLMSLYKIYEEHYEVTFYTRHDSIVSVFPNEIDLKIIPENVLLNEEGAWFAKQNKASETLIFADGYQFDATFQKKIKEKGYSLIYIDDLAVEDMYADIVVNHSPHIKVNAFKAQNYTQFALGTDYAMLRPLFLNELNSSRKIIKIKNVFVCFGGADFYDLTAKITQELICFKEIESINVIVGAAYKHKTIFELEKKDDRINILNNLSESEMLGVMKSSEMAILPTSTICYEAAAVGMLILGGYFVDNQEKIYQGFLENNMIYEIGDYNTISKEKLQSVLKEVLNFSTDDLNYYLNNQRKMFDGKQKERFLNLVNKIVC